MEYIDVEWVHKSEEEPIRLVSELDESRFEVRKLEFFRDGSVGFASSELTNLGTELGTLPVPPLAEINSSSEFLGVSISGDQFERLWRLYGR